MRDVHEVLRSTWGYTAFRPMQQQVVQNVLAGRDTLALLPTGGGKSLCFQVPALAMERLCLVVSPLIALMKDQVERLRAKGVRAVAITSGMHRSEIDNALESAALGKTAFLYVSPERLASELFQARLHRLPLGLIAVDEAHCISQWGYDFRPSYLGIAEVRAKHPKVPVLALTASATAQVAEDIMAKLAFRERCVVRGSFHRPELVHWVSMGEDKMGRLLRVAEHVPGSGIVYVRERRGTVRVAQFLRAHGITAEAYHAGLSLEERDRIQHAWAENTIRYVAATNAFGMGIDKADVRCVVHLEPPPDLESYYQEAGRGGRDGSTAHAFLLAHPSDEQKLREKLEVSFPSLNDVRRVYQAFADQHGIALGSGAFESYDLDLRELARRTNSTPAMVGSALKALELDGTIALSESARTPSRVQLRAGAGVVYDLRVRDARLGPVIETLLRMYGGLFEDPVLIEEGRISQQLGWSQARVTAALHELQRQEVLFYRPRTDAPMLTLMLPRRDAAQLTLNKEALAARAERARQRMEAMIGFTFRNDTCREVVLLSYFGEPDLRPCGRCDVCTRRPKPTAYALPDEAPLTATDVEEARWALDQGGDARRHGR